MEKRQVPEHVCLEHDSQVMQKAVFTKLQRRRKTGIRRDRNLTGQKSFKIGFHYTLQKDFKQ